MGNNTTYTARATTLAITQKIAKTSTIGLEWVRLRIHPLMAALINARGKNRRYAPTTVYGPTNLPAADVVK
jgi:hypothetical protein